MPVMLLRPTVLRHLFVVKAVYTTIGLFSVLGWVINANGCTIGNFEYTTKQTHLLGKGFIWPMISANEPLDTERNKAYSLSSSPDENFSARS
jgi:NCS1 family nucleobase:cation symporter-1